MLLVAINTYGQQLQNANWYFGDRAGMSFVPNTQNPVSISTGLSTWESSASYSNDKGELLFYTNGIEVYTGTHTLMTNGSGLNGNESNSQGVHPIKKPVDYNGTIENRIIPDESVYLVTIDGITGTKKGLYYSEVSINGNTGIGEVVAATKNTVLNDHNNIPIDQNYSVIGNWSEKLTSTPHCDAVNYWLVTQIGSNIYSYLVTSSGISSTPAMVSPAPLEIQNNNLAGAGQIKISPNNERIAVCYAFTNSVIGEIALGSFDSNTGAVIFDSNTIIPPASSNGKYMGGVEFSPNSQLVYFGIGYSLYQGNAYSATTNNIIKIYDKDQYSHNGLQLAINGKIYVSCHYSGPFEVSVINDPNNINNPDFQKNVVPITNGNLKINFPGWVHSHTGKCSSNYSLSLPETSLTPHTYHGKSFVVTGINYKITTGKNITLKAGKYIEMLPNTSIANGSVFLAEIVECNNCTSSTITYEQSKNVYENTKNTLPAKLMLYPNPANEYVNLSIEDQILKQATVISLEGITVFTGKIETNSKLDISSYKKGIYFITVTTENGDMYTEKLIIN